MSMHEGPRLPEHRNVAGFDDHAVVLGHDAPGLIGASRNLHIPERREWD
jgi:hypothetical protein